MASDISYNMEYRRLGKWGVQVSALSFGSWLTFGKQITDDVAEQLMHTAYEAGVNFFDNAESYAQGQSEIVMGNILKKMNWDRTTYLVSSKVYWGGSKPNQEGLSRKHVFEACHAALRRLQQEYLDFFFCHRPDKFTPIEETVWTMHNLVQQGKILYWGTSEWSAEEIREAHIIAEKHHLVPPAMEQPQYNMFWRERFEQEYAGLYNNFGMGTTIWSPLYSGVLSGKYNNTKPTEDTRFALPGTPFLQNKITEEILDKTRKLGEIAKEIGATMAQLAIAWCLKNPNVSTVILGASKLPQLEENLHSCKFIPMMTEEIMGRVENIIGMKSE